MQLQQSSEAALAAACAVAENLRLPFQRAELMADGANVLVRFWPQPVVCRIATGTALLRQQGEGLRRELAIAAWLAEQGAAVAPPSALLPAGPHWHDGFCLSFWEWLPTEPARFDLHAAGRALRHCHELLQAYPGELSQWGVLREAEQIVVMLLADGDLNAAQADRLRTRLQTVQQRLLDWHTPLQAVHGDATLRNVLASPRGMLWCDWEDCFLGPRAWDLACLLRQPMGDNSRLAEAQLAVQAYGEIPPPEQLEDLIALRNLQALLWGMLFARRHVDRRERIAERLVYLQMA